MAVWLFDKDKVCHRVGNKRYIHRNRSSLLAGTDPANGYDTECAQTIFVGHVARKKIATTNDKLIQPTEEIDTDLVQCQWKEEHIRT